MSVVKQILASMEHESCSQRRSLNKLVEQRAGVVEEKRNVADRKVRLSALYKDMCSETNVLQQHVEAATKLIKANKAHVVGAWVLLEELATVMPEAVDTKLVWSRWETTRTALLAGGGSGGEQAADELCIASAAGAAVLQPADRPDPAEVHLRRAGECSCGLVRRPLRPNRSCSHPPRCRSAHTCCD